LTDLSQVKGINARQIKLLQENGIGSAEALAMSPFSVVAEIKGLGEATAKKLIWNARNGLGMTEFSPASEINENVEYITTGSAALDGIFQGGIHTGKLTEVFGPFKSGKTNLSHTLSVTTQLPKEKGGVEGAVIYIDTENTFSKNKITRIAKRFELNPNEVLSHIFQARIYSSDHQSQMITKAEAFCKNRNVRLIVVDSLMALLRAEYMGIGMLAKRQGVLNGMIHALSRIAETYNVAVLLTNQVATKMMGMFAADDAIGGNIVAHGCHFRIMFKTKGFSSNSSLKRKAIIVDAPDLPPNECEFYITGAGIADTEEISIPKSSSDVFDVTEFYEQGDDALEVEENKEVEGSDGNGGKSMNINLTDVKGIGKGTAKQLNDQGILTIQDLLVQSPEDLAEKISGISSKKVREWQRNAKILI